MTGPNPHLATTPRAAELVGVGEDSFRTWAARRGLQPVRKIRLGRATVCVWNVDEVFAATRVSPRSWRKEQASGQ